MSKSGSCAWLKLPLIQPEQIWLPYICRYGDCAYKNAASVAFLNVEALRKHIDTQHLDVSANKAFLTCVVKGTSISSRVPVGHDLY